MGIWKTGIHIFIFKAALKNYVMHKDEIIEKKIMTLDECNQAINNITQFFEQFKNKCLDIIYTENRTLYNYLLTFNYFKQPFTEFK